jgi:Cu(I)/Ag(I) efflux system protein CusF
MRRIALAFLLLVNFQGAVQAGQDRPAPGSRQAEAPPMAAGEIRKVDRPAGSVLIRHAGLADLQLPAMTMMFQVPSPTMLKGLAPGDRVMFRAEKAGTGYRILELRPSR